MDISDYDPLGEIVYRDTCFKFVISGEFKYIYFDNDIFRLNEGHHSLGENFNILLDESGDKMYIAHNDNYLCMSNDKLCTDENLNDDIITLEKIFINYSFCDVYKIKCRNKYLNNDMLFVESDKNHIIVQLDSSNITSNNIPIHNILDGQVITTMNGIDIRNKGVYFIRLAHGGETACISIFVNEHISDENDIGRVSIFENSFYNSSSEIFFEMNDEGKTYLKVMDLISREEYYINSNFRLSINRIDDGIAFINSEYKGVYYIKNVKYNTYYAIKNLTNGYPYNIINIENIENATPFQFIHF